MKSRIYLLLAILLTIFLPIWMFILVPQLEKMPNNFLYTANVESFDNFYDSAKKDFAGGCSVAATACVDLSTPLAKYLKTIPIDPLGSTYTDAKTGYSVVVDANGIVTIKACGTEGTNNISASR